MPRVTTKLTPEFFWHNLRNTVHFHRGTTSVLDDFPGTVFVEITPHPALSPHTAPLVGNDPILCPMRRPKTPSDINSEVLAFTRTIGDLIVLGANEIDLTSLTIDRPEIPHTTFRTRSRNVISQCESAAQGYGLKFIAMRDGSSLHLQFCPKTHFDLAQRTINSGLIVPCARYLDMVSGAGFAIHTQPRGF